MTRRWQVVTIVLSASILVLLFLKLKAPPEPVLKGRTLSSWLDHHVASSAASPSYGSPGWKEAHEAIRKIGTNGIPTLLKMIRARDLPKPLLKLVQEGQRYRWLNLNYRPAISQNEEAEYAFEILSTNAAPAVPKLIEIYERNVSPSSQRCAALALDHIGRAAQAALPALIRNFTHTNRDVRFYAVSAAAKIGGEPSSLIPPLTGALKDSNVDVRWNALVGLGSFASRARSAVPEILKMLQDPGMVGSYSITQQVVTTLWRIAPEKTGKPLVVESSTPMIAQGVTTEPLKFLFHDRRQTLIPAGAPVPAVRQYWSSDPRPRLAMYRGAATPDGAEHFLGEFEVMDVPPSPDVNISTLCVIADGQIVLCARDNNRELFLEIRRVDNNRAK